MQVDKLKRLVRNGRLLEEAIRFPGISEVLLPKLEQQIEYAHRRVFDKRISNDSAKERIMYYNGLVAVKRLIDVIISEKDKALVKLEERGINI